MAISSQHKGKRAEMHVFGELLRRGAEVYTPLVDIGVDAIVRGEDGSFRELQVKSTEAPNQDRYFKADVPAWAKAPVSCISPCKECD